MDQLEGRDREPLAAPSSPEAARSFLLWYHAVEPAALSYWAQ